MDMNNQEFALQPGDIQVSPQRTYMTSVNSDNASTDTETPIVQIKLSDKDAAIHNFNGSSNAKSGKSRLSLMVAALAAIVILLTACQPAYERSGNTFTVNGVSFDMVSITGGTFMMGATAEQDSDAYSREYPVHQVTLSDYYIGKTEVTQALWKAVMGDNPCFWKGDNLPVTNVSWNDVQDFITRLNEITGENFRLPTEAEWEFAARGGTKSKGYKYSGSNNIDEVAWYDDNSDCASHPVGTKAPNELGIYDMSGNVHEWCQDRYEDYTGASQTDPTGPDTGRTRVDRGGCYHGYANFCRVSFRDGFTHNHHDDYRGFRLALSVEE